MRIFCLVFMLLLGGCSDPPPEIDQYGELASNTYTNQYFGVQLNLPFDWFRPSEETSQYMENSARRALAGDDKFMNAAMEQSQQYTRTLFTISKYPAGEPVDFNPNMMGMVERVTYAPGISSEWDYIASLRQVMERGGINVTFGRASTVTINDIEFVEMEASMRVMDIRVNQVYRFKYKDGYVLSFILTSSGSDQQDELENIFEDIQAI